MFNSRTPSAGRRRREGGPDPRHSDENSKASANFYSPTSPPTLENTESTLRNQCPLGYLSTLLLLLFWPEAKMKVERRAEQAGLFQVQIRQRGAAKTSSRRATSITAARLPATAPRRDATETSDESGAGHQGLQPFPHEDRSRSEGTTSEDDEAVGFYVDEAGRQDAEVDDLLFLNTTSTSSSTTKTKLQHHSLHSFFFQSQVQHLSEQEGATSAASDHTLSEVGSVLLPQHCDLLPDPPQGDATEDHGHHDVHRRDRSRGHSDGRAGMKKDPSAKLLTRWWSKIYLPEFVLGVFRRVLLVNKVPFLALAATDWPVLDLPALKNDGASLSPRRSRRYTASAALG
ncbi:unnamed protein product [Amoebophrya sp. A120]|nr:unnamed protein product [Amoebophrya sp. A120]|eukprot:GSA120T00007628001.1